MAKPLTEIENPMILDRPVYRSPENVVIYKPDPVCQCGCGKTIENVEFRTHEDEPLASEACWTRISYKEGYIRKEAS